jgi:hypothetical protein
VSGIDYGLMAHNAAELHMSIIEQLVEESYDDPESVLEEGTCISPLTGASFDGCMTCLIREVLAGAWPVIERMVDDATGLAAMPDPHQIFEDNSALARPEPSSHESSDPGHFGVFPREFGGDAQRSGN